MCPVCHCRDRALDAAPAHNRKSRTFGATTNIYSYEPTSHRLTSISGVSPRTYDANGNTLAHASLGWSYDARNRPRELRQSGALVRTWYYNGKGERVRRVFNAAPASNTVFVYDEAGRLLGEYTDTGARLAEYVWIDDMLVGILKSHDGTTYQYVETDHLGTPRAIINPATNTTIWRWDLTATAFGEHLADTNPDANAVAYSFNLRYPGQYWDGIARIHYNYYRDYDAQTGRYTQSDPIGLFGGMSTYSYAGGNALAAIDPFGLTEHWPGAPLTPQERAIKNCQLDAYSKMTVQVALEGIRGVNVLDDLANAFLGFSFASFATGQGGGGDRDKAALEIGMSSSATISGAMASTGERDVRRQQELLNRKNSGLSARHARSAQNQIDKQAAKAAEKRGFSRFAIGVGVAMAIWDGNQEVIDCTCQAGN